jgi:protoheme ferro-lyase
MRREDDYLVKMEHTVIPSWYQRSGYVKAMATLIEQELQKFPVPTEVRLGPVEWSLSKYLVSCRSWY